MFDHYNLENLRKVLADPNLFRDEIRKINRGLNKRIFTDKGEEEFDVIRQDWDNLIILDGCRYGLFEEHSEMSGSLSCVVSQGGHSNEFMKKTFSGRELHDTVYITANPWSEGISDDVFFTKRTTYTDEIRGGQARLPEDVAQLATDTFERYPNKKYIVHFMQPNNPYVGPKAEKHRKELLNEQNVVCTEMDTPGSETASNQVDAVKHLRQALRKGYITKETMIEVYAENLQVVSEHATRVINELGGKTAVTADHGDMFGERLSPLFIKEYSHWEGVYSDYIREVPWLVMEPDDRRQVEPQTPLSRESLDDDSVMDHLKTMGYLSG